MFYLLILPENLERLYYLFERLLLRLEFVLYCPRVLGQWFDGIRFYAAASSPRRSRRTWAGLR